MVDLLQSQRKIGLLSKRNSGERLCCIRFREARREKLRACNGGDLGVTVQGFWKAKALFEACYGRFNAGPYIVMVFAKFLKLGDTRSPHSFLRTAES